MPAQDRRRARRTGRQGLFDRAGVSSRWVAVRVRYAMLAPGGRQLRCRKSPLLQLGPGSGVHFRQVALRPAGAWRIRAAGGLGFNDAATTTRGTRDTSTALACFPERPLASPVSGALIAGSCAACCVGPHPPGGAQPLRYRRTTCMSALTDALGPVYCAPGLPPRCPVRQARAKPSTGRGLPGGNWR
jgi:hypothetical protein